MRYNVFRKAPDSKHLFSDSQASTLNTGVVNALSLPEGRNQNKFGVLARERKYETIILFNRGYYYFDGEFISTHSPHQIEGIRDLANILNP